MNMKVAKALDSRLIFTMGKKGCEAQQPQQGRRVALAKGSERVPESIIQDVK